MREGSQLYKDLLKAGLKKGTASNLASGKRQPSLKFALQLYRDAGIKVGPIAGLRKNQIASLLRGYELEERASA